MQCPRPLSILWETTTRHIERVVRPVKELKAEVSLDVLELTGPSGRGGFKEMGGSTSQYLFTVGQKRQSMQNEGARAAGTGIWQTK